MSSGRDHITFTLRRRRRRWRGRQPRKPGFK